MFRISKDVMGHSSFTAVLEPMEEFPVGDGAVPVGGNTAAGQKLSQIFLLQLQTELGKDVKKVVKTNL